MWRGRERKRGNEFLNWRRGRGGGGEGTDQETLGGRFVGRGHWLALGGKEIYEEILVEMSPVFSMLYL